MTPDALAAVEAWFEAFVAGYAAPDGRHPLMLQIKVEHSRLVAADTEGIARDEGWGEADVREARALGLCHDAGRFPQYARFRTFSDSQSVNHGRLGAEVLREARVLETCPEAVRERILAGVNFHNDKALPESLAGRALAGVKLVRDADKLDIMRVLYGGWKSGEIFRRPEIALGLDLHGPPSMDLMDELRQRRSIGYNRLKTLADVFLTQLSWVYDFHFPASYRRIRERRLLEGIAEVLPAHPEIEAEVSAADAHVNARLLA